MKKQPSPPPAPDYAAAAQQQGQANLTAAQQGNVMSNPNIVSPYGNQTVTWGQADPNNPGGAQQATVTQTLTPDAQAALTSQQQVQKQEADLASQGINKASGVLSSGFNYQGPGIQTSVDTGSGLQYAADTSGIARMPVNAGMTAQNAIMSRLQPQIDQTQKATDQRLANQGIPVNSEAWNNAMRQQGQDFNDLYSQAALQGIGVDMNANNQGFGQQMQQAGLFNQASGQQFNQNLQGAQFANNAQQQNYGQQLGLYNQPLNQITALMSGSQIQNPQFQAYQGQNVQAAPTFAATQAQAQYNQGLYGQQMAGYNAGQQALGQGLGTAAQAAMMFSDRRLKSNIERVGTHPLGIGIYDYDIFGRRERGVMAQELLAVKPEAVATHDSGYLMVNYDLIGGRP